MHANENVDDQTSHDKDALRRLTTSEIKVLREWCMDLVGELKHERHDWNALTLEIDDFMREIGAACSKPGTEGLDMIAHYHTQLHQVSDEMFGEGSETHGDMARVAATMRALDHDGTHLVDTLGKVEASFWRLAGQLWLFLGFAVARGASATRLREVLLSPPVSLPLASPTQDSGSRKTRKWKKKSRAFVEQTPVAIKDSTDEKTATSEPTRVSPAAPLEIDGRKLRKSVIPTWLGLVVLSWVSLFWGALITVPFGIGLGIFLMFIAGIVVVPLWGTFFGFLGMGAAGLSTLSTLKFKKLPADHKLTQKTEEFAKRLDMPTPKVGTINVYNALAMGAHRNSATVAMGQPLMEALSASEVEAVLAHELGHVVNGDMRRMVLMRTFQNACVWFMIFHNFKQLARWIVSWVAELCILSFSRNREYWADAIGAALAGKDAMIGALNKLDKAPEMTNLEHDYARFMFRGRVASLFSTHPTTKSRIEALEKETYLRRLPLKR